MWMKEYIKPNGIAHNDSMLLSIGLKNFEHNIDMKESSFHYTLMNVLVITP